MIAKARDIMTTRFQTLEPNLTLSEAIRRFQSADSEGHYKAFGMVVVNERRELMGMLSMFDILLFMRPDRSRQWEGMDDGEINRLFEHTCVRVQTALVREIMTPDVITVTPDTSVIKVLDVMIRRYIRRLPVVEGKEMKGMVYMSAVFDYLSKTVLDRLVWMER